MHDIRSIRDDPEGFDTMLARRGLPALSPQVLNLDRAWREATTEVERIQADVKAKSQDIGKAAKSGDRAAVDKGKAAVARWKKRLADLEAEQSRRRAARDDLLMGVPNLPLDDVPDGDGEDANVELRRWGAPRAFDFPPKEHWQIGEAMGLFDFEAAAKLSGSRFAVMSGALARLHRALGQFMLDAHTGQNGLTEVWTPVLVREDAMIGTGQLPKFAEDSYRTEDGRWLIPTAEVTLTNLAAGEILSAADLPLRYTAHTQCFRSEAGSAGKDTRGMLRQHQFEKVEMVSIVRPEDSADELERMTRCAEGILEALNLPYRRVVLCTGDMGFGARKTHDIEVWLPGQNAWREISSCSTCGDFQARRMNARFRRDAAARPEFVHTLNGSGLAVGRTMIAVLENGQQRDGSVTLPEGLRPWLGGCGAIAPDGRLLPPG